MTASHEGSFGPVEPLMEARAREGLVYVQLALDEHFRSYGTFYDHSLVERSEMDFTHFPTMVASLYEPGERSENARIVAGSAFSFAIRASELIHPHYDKYEPRDYLSRVDLQGAETYLGHLAQNYLNERPTLEQLINANMTALTKKRTYYGLAKTVAGLTFKQVEETAQFHGTE